MIITIIITCIIILKNKRSQFENEKDKKQEKEKNIIRKAKKKIGEKKKRDYEYNERMKSKVRRERWENRKSNFPRNIFCFLLGSHRDISKLS